MPERIQPDLLRARLCPLAEAAQALPEMRAYQDFYGLDMAHHPGIHSRLGRFQVGDYQIVCQSWWPDQPRGTLLILHGYYDHMGLYRHAVDWGLQLGLAVLACDLPGHGLSSGPRASINEFEEYQAVLGGLLQQAAQLDLPQPWHMLGQSTGGAIALDHLLHHPDAPGLGQTILLAPLVRPRAWGWSRVSYEVLRRFVEHIPRRYSENSGDAAFLEFIQSRDPLQPAVLPTAWVGALSRWIPRIEGAADSPWRPLIIQGEADMTVDWQHNLSVLQNKFDNPEVLRLPAARHHLVNEREELRREYFDFIRERMG